MRNSEKQLQHTIKENEKLKAENKKLSEQNKLLFEAKEKIKESEKKYRLLAESMRDVIVIISPHGKLLYISPSAEKFSGYIPEEEIGNHISKYFAKKIEIISALKLLLQVLITHEGGTFEFMFKPKNKAPFLVEHTFVPLVKSGKIYAIQMILRDISVRKKSENDLKKSEERYRSLFDNVPIGLYRTSPQGEIVDANFAMVKMLGYPDLKTLLNTNVNDIFVSKEKRKSEVKILEKNNIVKNYTIKLHHYKGDIIFVNDTAKAIKNKKGEIIYFEGSLENITARKKAELRLKKSKQKLMKSNQTKDKFFSIIAHDLRSPFNAMLGFSDILVNNFDKYDDKKKKKIVGIIRQNVQQTYKLLENLLTWSRLQRGIINFKPTKENLYYLSAGVIELLKQTAESKSITLKNEIPNDIFIKADINMLSAILRNLISNAVKFTQKDGEVKIKAKEKQDFIEIIIEDNGIGISPEIQSKLFKITENVSTVGTENEKGTGLGLILCKEFVEKHGGKIQMKSKIGKGSKFSFIIPRK